jgi:hypothetical protein
MPNRGPSQAFVRGGREARGMGMLRNRRRLGRLDPGRGGRVTADNLIRRWRKVRAPQSRALGNTQSGRPEGKCHRKLPPGSVDLRRGAAR